MERAFIMSQIRLTALFTDHKYYINIKQSLMQLFFVIEIVTIIAHIL